MPDGTDDFEVHPVGTQALLDSFRNMALESSDQNEDKVARLAELQAEIRSLKAERVVARLALKFTDHELEMFCDVAIELADILRVRK